jgi:acyl-CoA dehydrogenase
MSLAPVEAARGIAHAIARPHALEVDRQARFPAEAFDALARQRLLGAGIPVSHGGLGCSVGEIAAICTELGRACASTASIYAMHQIQVQCLVRHGQREPFFQQYLKEIAQTQALIASATSEVGVGGDLRTSLAAVEVEGGRFRLNKRCSAISYFHHAQAILVTARRDPGAGAGDQVMALVRKSDCEAVVGQDWDALGMRGTCTPPVELRAIAPACQILPVPFAMIASLTMVPFSHLTWAAGWLGLATDAFDIASRMLAEDAARSEALPIGARSLEAAAKDLHLLRAGVRDAAAELEQLVASPQGEDMLFSLPYALRSNHLKLVASELTSSVCRHCLQAGGLRAYTNNSPYSLGRHVRDALGASLMIANDRISATNAQLLMVPNLDADGT